MFIEGKEIEKEEDGLITYKDGSTERYSKEWAAYLATQESMEADKFRFYKISKAVSNALKDFKDGRFTEYEIENYMGVLQQSLQKAKNDAVCQIFGLEDPKNLTFDVTTEYALIHAKNHKDG